MTQQIQRVFFGIKFCFNLERRYIRMDLLHAKLTIFSSEQTIVEIPTATQHEHDDDVSVADSISIGIINHHNDGEVVHAVLVDGNMVTQHPVS